MKLRLVAALAALLALPGVAFAAPEAFPNGFNNVPATHWMRGRDVLEIPYPTRWVSWFDEFTKYTAGDWVVTEISDSTQALADADDGILLLTTLTTEDDAAHLQSVGELFTFESGKKAYFEARLRIGDATQSDFVIGLQVRDTTPLAVANGVVFQKDDGDARLDFHSMSGSVDTASTGVYTVVDNTYLTIAYYYDGGTNFQVAVNDTVVASVTATPPTTELTVSFGVQAGSAAADVLSLDYVWAVKER